MKLHKARRPRGLGINIAPLTDVVFLLIIFFMTVSQFSRIEVERVRLPEAAKGEKPEVTRPTRLVILVTTEGTLSVENRAQTQESLDDRVAEFVKGRSPEKLTVLLRGDRGALWSDASGVLKSCARHGIANVRIAVVEPGAGAP
jgi:biopolymer transport protein ExbD